ncbi:MAG: HIT family protein [Mycolicibacterium sp.]|uniref:HIT family protein n=1 Tax=Mycolicibacterium sp. TaxID=2320850 RepID=UPI003D09ED6F
MTTNPAAGCVFCSEACETMETYEDLGESSPSYLLARLPGVRILSDNAPVAPGHVLVVPDRHERSAALLGRDLVELQPVLSALCRGLAEVFSQPVVVFEHGTGGNMQKYQCCLDHVHLHAVPTTADVWSYFEERQATVLERPNHLADLSSLGDREYFYAQAAGRPGVVWAADNHPSQIFRRLIADHEGMPLWNWQDRILLGHSEARVDEIRTAVAHAAPAMRYLPSLVG